MRNVNSVVLTSAGAVGDVNGNAIDANQLISGSFHAVVDGTTIDGVLKIQASNDVAPVQYTSPNGVGVFTPTNWVDIPSASATITNAADVIVTLAQMNYRWVRAVFDYTSGGQAALSLGSTIDIIANEWGAGGNAISIELLDPGAPNEALTVTVTGNLISVSLATDGASAITSTYDDVLAAINGDVDASALVTVEGSDSGVASVESETNLSGGNGSVQVSMNALSM